MQWTRCCALALIPLFLGTGLALGAASAADLYVSTSGSDSNPATQAAPFRTIQKGVATAQNGDKVFVLAGTYSLSSTVNIGGGRSLIGVNRPQVTQTFSGTMFKITGSNVTVSGLNMTGANRNRTGESCSGTEAIRVNAVDNINILDNVAATFTCGFVLDGTNGFSIRDNYLSRIKYAGVVLYPGLNGTIDRNTLVDVNHDGPLGQNAYGIVASGTISRNVTISNNYVKNAPTWECYDTHDGQSVHWYDNTCVRPGRVGINSAFSGVQQVNDVRHERNFIDGGGLTGQWNSIVITGTGNVLNNTVRNMPGGGCAFHAPNATVSGNSCSSGPEDIIPPSIPTGLQASASGSGTDLSWKASVDNVSVAAYEVYRDGVLLASAAGPSYRDTNPGSAVHTYRVRARDAAGNRSDLSSPASSRAGDAEPAATEPPPADTSPPSTPGGLTATAVSTSEIDLSWWPSDDDVGVTAYEVQRGGVKRAEVTGTEYHDTGLAVDTTYNYRVRARDAAGNWSGFSSSVAATTGGGGGGSVTPEVSASPTSLAPGGSIAVTVSNGPGGRLDWVGLYAVGAVSTEFLDWRYLNGSKTAPASGVTSASITFTMPITPGSYEFRFFPDDIFAPVLAASQSILVEGASRRR